MSAKVGCAAGIGSKALALTAQLMGGTARPRRSPSSIRRPTAISFQVVWCCRAVGRLRPSALAGGNPVSYVEWDGHMIIDGAGAASTGGSCISPQPATSASPSGGTSDAGVVTSTLKEKATGLAGGLLHVATGNPRPPPAPARPAQKRHRDGSSVRARQAHRICARARVRRRSPSAARCPTLGYRRLSGHPTGGQCSDQATPISPSIRRTANRSVVPDVIPPGHVSVYGVGPGTLRDAVIEIPPWPRFSK